MCRYVRVASSENRSSVVFGYGLVMSSTSDNRLFKWSGIAALVGAAMWTYKSVVILVTGDQPDHWFELGIGVLRCVDPVVGLRG